MRLLHTSDWHVGATVRGNSRAAEHRAVLAEMAAVAAEQAVDLVVVAGDLFETAGPSPESAAIVYRALLDLSATAEVVVIAGNHDNAGALAAVAPLLELGRVHAVPRPLRPDDGGVRTIATGGGELDVAALPFVSQRGIVRADALMSDAAFQHAQAYGERLAMLVGRLADACAVDRPAVMVAHGYVLGATRGGGERAAHLVDEYAVTAQSFPPTLAYVALGHLHRAQQVPGPAPLHYCGSPLQLDFAESDNRPGVNVVDIDPGLPAKVTHVPLVSGRSLVSVTGTVEELAAQAPDLDPTAWIRARVREPARAGLADEVRRVLGDRCVDVVIDRPAPDRSAGPRPGRHRHRSAHELFVDYLVGRGIDDPPVVALFDELVDELSDADPAATP